MALIHGRKVACLCTKLDPPLIHDDKTGELMRARPGMLLKKYSTRATLLTDLNETRQGYSLPLIYHIYPYVRIKMRAIV